MAKMHVEVYEDAAGLWRWRIKATNGRILADSGEGYVTRSNAWRAYRTLWSLIIRGET